MLPPLIPRDTLFGAPARLYPAMDPGARRVAYVGPVDGVPNLWLQTIGRDDARPVTADTDGGVVAFNWAADGRHLLYPKDNDGDECTHVHALDVRCGTVRDLTPFPGARAKVIGVEPVHPGHVLVAMNRRVEHLPDVYRIELGTAECTLVAENPGFAGWLPDRDLVVRCAFRWNPNGGLTIMVREPDGPWRPLHEVDSDDSTSTRAVAFTADGSGVVLLSPSGADTVRLLHADIATGATKVLFEDPAYDAEGVSVSPRTGAADLVVVNRDRRCLEAVDPGLIGDLRRLREMCRGAPALLGRSGTDRTWLVMDYIADAPTRYLTYDRDTRRVRQLFTHHPALGDYRLAGVEPFAFVSRDGLDIRGYLTFPIGVPRRALPTVLAVHGGPWSRDSWGTGGDAQWLANRGYLCVQVNYRGSTGYGKAFVNAGDREWGGRMQLDLLDAVDWLVARGLTDPGRVAIYGSSYGGYAALVGATFTPDVFRAAIAVCAPSDLRTFVASAMRASELLAPRIRRRIGDPATDAGLLWSRSPVSRVDDLRIPVLVAHGANDPRVPRAEAEQIVAALRRKDIPHEYLLFPDEGHGFMKPRNRIAFYAAAERFLAEHLGGRCEP